MMNTMAVLLVDRGVAASEKYLEGYAQLHRILLALRRQYPVVRSVVDQRLKTFLRSDSERTKARCPSLGDLLVCLSLSEDVSWTQMAKAYILESLDRNVLWVCRDDPGLAKVTQGDQSRLDRHLKAARVSLRILMFHTLFLRLVCRPTRPNRRAKTLAQVADASDLYLGRVPLATKRAWQSAVEDLFAVETWPAFFRFVQISCPSRHEMLHMLEQAVVRSENKGYHERGMDFSRVHKSGVSKILLRGESYTTPPNLREVRLYQRWGVSDDVQFVDASCLCFDEKHNFLAAVDWSNRQYRSVQHSGDQMDRDKGTGEHVITIRLPQIQRVKSLYFVMSAWTGTLSNAIQPAVCLRDGKSDVELCSYSLDDKSPGESTCAIMCVLRKRSTGLTEPRTAAGGSWELVPVGQFCQGRASGGNVVGEINPYAPVIRAIQALQP